MVAPLPRAAEATLFAEVAAAHPKLLEWLRAARENNVRTMTVGMKSRLMRAAQGRVQQLDELIDLLDPAARLR